jgi:5-hydroxyisourate hydrolase
MAASQITVSTHVLDVARGAPAQGIPVVLERLDDGGQTSIGAAVTDADGRASLVPDAAPALAGGRYRLTFDTAAYGAAFYPQVIVVVELAAGCGHTHIPLLLSAFGYTTYRGS